MMRLVTLSALLAVAAARCPNDCSGHGSCNVYSECECYRNWMAADCSERVCYFGHAFIDTPQGDLNMDGLVGDGLSASDTALHSADEVYDTQWSNVKAGGWEFFNFDSHGRGKAAATDADSTWDEAHFYRECSNKGVCNRQTGLCQCFKGYEGEGCTRTACPNACSGHGVCERLVDEDVAYRAWDSYKTQRCKCDPGYLGPDCSLRDCPRGDDPITHTEVDEVQVLAFGANDDSTPDANKYHGHFALQFEDEFGDMWTTKTLSFPHGAGTARADDANNAGNVKPSCTSFGINSGADAAGACSFTSTTELANALKALPNDAVPDATVTFVSDTATPPTSWSYAITFTANSGPLPNMHVIYELTNMITEAGAVTDASAVADADAVIYDSAGIKGAAYGTTCGDSANFFVVHDGTNGNRDAGAQGVTSNKCGAGLTGMQAGVVGNKENSICSNRGVCDYSTGLCKCFNGYTNADCSQQNALAMS